MIIIGKILSDNQGIQPPELDFRWRYHSSVCWYRGTHRKSYKAVILFWPSSGQVQYRDALAAIVP